MSRNLLYSLPGGTTPQFSNLRFSKEAALHCDNPSKPGDQSWDDDDLCHNMRNQCLSVIQRAIQSAERLVCFGLDLFENYPNKKWACNDWSDQASLITTNEGEWYLRSTLDVQIWKTFHMFRIFHPSSWLEPIPAISCERWCPPWQTQGFLLYHTYKWYLYIIDWWM